MSNCAWLTNRWGKLRYFCMAVCTGPPPDPMESCSNKTAREDNSNLLDSVLTVFDRKKSFGDQMENVNRLDENSNQSDSVCDLIPRDADANGAAEFAAYCKNLGRPRSPPPKPKRNKSRTGTGSTDSQGSADRPSSISSELQEIIESAFGHERPDESAANSDAYRLEMPRKFPPITPYPTPERDLNELEFNRQPAADSPYRGDTLVARDEGFLPRHSSDAKSVDSMAFIDDSVEDDQDDFTLERKLGSNMALDCISLNSALSDGQISVDWAQDDCPGDTDANPETASLMSYTSTSPVNGKTEVKSKNYKLRKQISKAVAQKQKMGALFDVAAGNAGDQLKKIKRLKSVRFPGTKSRQARANK